MARRFEGTLLLALLCALAALAHAQAGGPKVFGTSVVPLTGPWRFATGDSPVDPQTGRFVWAEPEFDDSHWEQRELKPVPGMADPFNGDPRYVPGWTATGHAGYMGYAWYRMRVPAAAEDGGRLALACPSYVDDGYQVYANGKLVGSFGDFGNPGEPPRVTSTAPAMVLLPETNAATVVVAFRVWMGPMGYTHSPYAGGLHYAPQLGEQSSIAAQVQLDRLELTQQSLFAPFEGVLLFLLGLVAAGLILFDPDDRVYLWLAAVLVFTAAADGVLALFMLTPWLSLRVYFFYFDVLVNPLVLCGWIMVWWHWFRLRWPAWLPRAAFALMVVYMITKAIGGGFFYGADLHPPAPAFGVLSVAARLLFLPLLVGVVALGIRKHGLDGWLVLPAVLPLMVAQFASELVSRDLPVKWAPFGITIFVGQVSNLVSAAAISLLLLRRLLLSVQRQKQLALDLLQAQEVHQVILPEALTTLPGLRIESEYRPEQEIGGDFFQIIEDPKDGGVLIVAGDVAGKGLKAGMQVALLVGAARAAAETSLEPEFVLGVLNRRLLRQGDAQATCLAIHIARDGAARLANAGHMTPYLSGAELPMEGALPLGMLAGAEPSTLHFRMEAGDRLLVLSDGVAEAMNAEGELFGFARMEALLRTNANAAEVASAAQEFGQQDDISVIVVTRTAG